MLPDPGANCKSNNVQTWQAVYIHYRKGRHTGQRAASTIAKTSALLGIWAEGPGGYLVCVSCHGLLGPFHLVISNGRHQVQTQEEPAPAVLG